MVYGVYVMRDQRTCYLTPAFDATDASAVRNFEAAMSRADSLLHTHSEDFSLYKLGEYDAATGALLPYPEPRLLVDGKSFVRSE